MIKNILSEQFKDLIAEDTLNVIEEAFNQAVEEKSKEKISLEIENVKTKLDESYSEKLTHVIGEVDKDHTAKLKRLVEAIDMDHATKLQKLVNGIDKKYTAMLEQVVRKYETEMTKKAVSLQENLVEEISNYIDLYIDKTVPKEQISEAVANIKASQQLKQIRQIVGITEEFVDSEIKDALIDGKNTIDSLKSELNESIKENIALNQRANKAEAYILLEQKTSDMPSTKKQYINRLLINKTPEYIQENFQYVVDMFEKDSTEEVNKAKETVKEQFTQIPRVDRQLVEEQRNFNNEIERDSTSGEGVSGYLNEMKKLGKFSR